MMANGRDIGNKRRASKVDDSRDAGGFVALPWSVTDCKAFKALSAQAIALLLEVARQYRTKDSNNGRLILTRAYLAERGWNSVDTIQRAKAELLAGGFIYETFKGHRPNRASWYALTWYALPPHSGYDPGAVASFRRSAYRDNDPLPVKPTREQLFRKWDLQASDQKCGPSPTGGTVVPCIAPPVGPEGKGTAPTGGAMTPNFLEPSGPPAGHHLDKTSLDDESGGWRHFALGDAANDHITH